MFESCAGCQRDNTVSAPVGRRLHSLELAPARRQLDHERRPCFSTRPSPAGTCFRSGFTYVPFLPYTCSSSSTSLLRASTTEPLILLLYFRMDGQISGQSLFCDSRGLLKLALYVGRIWGCLDDPGCVPHVRFNRPDPSQIIPNLARCVLFISSIMPCL